MKTRKIIILLIVCLSVISCGGNRIKVALVAGPQDVNNTETDSLAAMIRSFKGEAECDVVALGSQMSLKGYDVVWFHRADTTAITQAEKDAGPVFSEYVSGGGRLILSMEAVRLLNEWDIEPEPVQTYHYNAVDRGFGRKLGFHARREHPLFDKLFGGAYPWHGKEDNVCRVLGYFDDKVPSAPGSEVAGILWEYIYYRPRQKILWTTPVGEGKVLAIGGCLYYGRENFHAPILRRFTYNCLRYMGGTKGESREMYWDYGTPGVIAMDDEYETVTVSGPTAWTLPEPEMSLSRPSSDYYFTVPTRRNMIVGMEKGGVKEIWTHPVMSLRDYRVWLDVEGQGRLIPLTALESEFETRPNAAIRRYRYKGGTLTEILTSSADSPVTVMHYEWDIEGVKRVVVDFKSNLRFMWPYDSDILGSLYYEWSDALNAFIVRDSEGEFGSVVGANRKGEPLESGRFDGFDYRGKRVKGQPTDKLQAAASVAFDVTGGNSLDIVASAGNTGLKSIVADYMAAVASPRKIYDESAGYYEKYLGDRFYIETPDPVFNEGFKWVVLSSAQFIAETPGVGTSLMAGYSASDRGWGGAQKVSGRPGYAWYFGRDAVWSGYAFDNIGDFATVKNILETFIRFQQVDGKIYHELTTSGSVHFDASDATPLFVCLMAHYVRASGDVEFLKENMDAVHLAMDYCYKTDTDGDGLIEITNVGHGWLEGGQLFGSHTEFYLAGVWNAALEDAAYLSGLAGHDAKRQKYAADARSVNETINSGFWNEKGYYNYGKYKDGTYTEDFTILPAVPVFLGVTDHERSREMTREYAGAGFSSDWGVRMVDASNSVFNPTSYHFGSIWPLFTGCASLAEYAAGLYTQGYVHMMSNLLNYDSFSLGRVPEVINGLVYKPAGVTLHQCWSETMVLLPMVEGMLGFKPNAPADKFSFSPRLPVDWNKCDAGNLYVGAKKMGFSMKKDNGKIIYDFTVTGGLAMDFEPVFAPGTTVSEVTVDGSEAEFVLADNGEYATLSLPVELSGKNTVAIELSEGISALPSIVRPEYDDYSSGFRVMGQKLEGGTLKVLVEGNAGSSGILEFMAPDGYSVVEGAGKVNDKGGGVFSAEVRFGKSDKPYVRKTVEIKR